MSDFDPLDSPLAMLPRATVQQWLTEALNAEQALTTGSKLVTASYTQGDGSRSVTYQQADLQILRARIATLTEFLTGNRPRRGGPMRVMF